MSNERPLTPEEKYFTFLDQMWPTNSMLVAELDLCLPIERVEAAWRAYCELRVYPRLTPTAELTLRDSGTGSPDFSAEELPSGQWQSRIDAETMRRYPLGTGLRLRYLTSPEEKRSWLVVVGHHAVLDGRVVNIQPLFRLLDGQEVEPQQEISIADEPRSFPWREDRREMVRALRAVREEHAAVGEVGPVPWPASTPERQVRTHRFVYDGDTPKAMIGGMKARGIRPLPAVSAAWLSAVQQVYGGNDPMTLQLATAIDLVPVPADPDVLKPMTVAVVANRFRVEPGKTWELAKDINAALATSVGRGDGDLFIELSRVGAIDDLERGRDLVADGIAAAPPTVGVTNLGVVDAGSDPEWITSMCPYLGPYPNHVVLATGLTYRGQLMNSVAIDSLRVSPDDQERLLSLVQDQMAQLMVMP